MAERVHTVVDSPVGPLTLVASDGALVGLYMHRQRYLPAEESFGAPDDGPFGAVVAQLAEYFAGRRTVFELALELEGTPFQRTVWSALLEIPCGETMTYREMAERIGRPPSAARAVGTANGHNPIGIIVPCHRLVGTDGSLTGYAGGLDRKRFLLDLEQGRSTIQIAMVGGVGVGRAGGR